MSFLQESKQQLNCGLERVVRYPDTGDCLYIILTLASELASTKLILYMSPLAHNILPQIGCGANGRLPEKLTALQQATSLHFLNKASLA